jgi:hypothetical protein
MVRARPGWMPLRIFVRLVAWAWLTAKRIDLPRLPSGAFVVRVEIFALGFEDAERVTVAVLEEVKGGGWQRNATKNAFRCPVSLSALTVIFHVSGLLRLSLSLELEKALPSG